MWIATLLVYLAAAWAFALSRTDSVAVLIVVAGLKLASLAVLLRELANVHGAVREGRLSAWRVALVWSASLALYVLVLAALRDPLADQVRTATTHVTAHRFVGYEPPVPMGTRAEDVIVHESWVAAWDGGLILTRELLVVLGLCAAAAWALGRARSTALVAGAIAALTVASAYALGFVRLTHDLFHEGILVAFLALDLALPVVPLRPESAISSLAWVVLAVSSRTLSTRYRSAVSEPSS